MIDSLDNYGRPALVIDSQSTQDAMAIVEAVHAKSTKWALVDL